jgi:RNA polymerase sigma-70 factor (ECF subfamily)
MNLEPDTTAGADDGDEGAGKAVQRANDAPAAVAGPTVTDPFRELVQRHQTRLYRFVLKNIGNPSDAEELAQQAFVEAALSYRSFRGEAELSTWLYGNAMNLVRNYLSRAPHRRYQIEDESALEHFTAPDADPAAQVENAQLLQRLQAELDELPTEMRDVLLLVALDDLSYEEAAVMLSIPIGTVRSRVSRARATLRKRFSEAGLDDLF